MPSMAAILRIDARTSGQQGLKEMDGLIRRIGPGADGSVGGVSRLSRALGDMGTIAGGIGLANLGGRMIAFAGDAVQAGDETLLVERRMSTLGDQMGETARMTEFARQSAERFSLSQLDASKAVADLYGRLRPIRIGLEDIQSTFNGVNSVARVAGLSVYDTKEAFKQLGQAMGSGRLQGDEFRAIMERMPQIGVAIVKVFNDIARNKGLVQITKERADEMISEVKAGEKRQTEIMKEQARERERAAESETDGLLREIGKRYDAMRRALDNQYEDGDRNTQRRREEEADRLSESFDKETERRLEQIEERYRLEKKQRERAREDLARERESDQSYQQMLENMTEKQRIELKRREEDQIEAFEKSASLQEEEEKKAIKKSIERQAEATKNKIKEEQAIQDRAFKDQKRIQEEAIQDRQRAEEETVRNSLEKQKQDMQTHLNSQIEANKKANEDIIANLLARVRVTQGDLKRMASEGLITPDIMIKALKELEKIKIPSPSPLQEFNKAMGDLSQEVGDNLLPVLTPLIEGLAGLVKRFGQLPEPLQATAIGLTAVGIGIAGIRITTQTLGGIGSLIKSFRDLAGAAKAAEVAADVVDVIKPKIEAPIDIRKPFKPQQLGLDLSKKFQGYQLPLELELATPKKLPKIPPIKADVIPDVPPSALSRLMGSLGSIGRALAGLTFEAGKFFVLLGREALLAIPGVARLGVAFANLRIGATIAGWAGVIGPFVGTFTAAMGGLLAWMTGTFLPTMIGIFSGPVGWIALGVAAVVAGMVFFREPIMKFFGWAYEQVAGFWKAVFGFIYDTQLKPWVDLWNNVLSKPITDTVKNWLSGITKFFGGILDFIDKTWLKQWAAYWDQFTQDPFAFIQKVQRGFDDLGASVMDAWKKIPGILQSVWDSVLNGMGRTWRWMIGGAIDGLNGIIQLWNSVSANVNKMPTPFKLPIIPEIQRAQIPGFARGAFIDKPTLGLIGEGRNPREYIIPEGGMDAAAAGWQRGLRGRQLELAWQSPGLAPGRASMEPSSGGMGGVVIPEVRIQISQTGNTLQMPDGSQWVSRDEAMALVAHGSRLTLDAVARLNRSAAGRSAGGGR